MVRDSGDSMKIRIQEGLLYVTVILTYRNRQIALEHVLLDTGSVSTIFSVDKVLEIGLLKFLFVSFDQTFLFKRKVWLRLEPEDVVRRIRGIGGTEFVFTKQVDRLSLGELQVNDFEIEVGAMEYGLELDGIVGLDFLLEVGANIDLARLEVYKSIHDCK